MLPIASHVVSAIDIVIKSLESFPFLFLIAFAE